MKIILVIGDGMADRPIERLDWKTPLETAHKPSLNRIAKTGICGILDPLQPGVPPGSDTATLALLGYDAPKVYSGRGALEAIGSNIKVSKGDISFRCNFATVDPNLVVLDRRAGRIANIDASKLAESLQKTIAKKNLGTKILFKNTVQHRAILIIRKTGLSPAVSSSDPGKVGEKALDVKPLSNSSAARLTARLVNNILHEFHLVLRDHPTNRDRIKRGLPPANIVLCRGASTAPKMHLLSQKYSVDAACVGATSLVKGVCKAAGMKLINVKGATGTSQSDLKAKAKAATRAIKTNDFILLHVKATDVASHDRNIHQKIKMIEKIDHMVEHLLQTVNLDSTYLAITADHTSSCITGHHEGDPVPVAISGRHVRRDEVERFDERECAKGGLNRINGRNLMNILMNLIGKTKKFGV